jgi:hypothetical protein
MALVVEGMHMLVLMQILRCGSGRQKEALKRLHWIHSLMAERSDSGGCIVAKHLGNPIDLLVLRFWETREAMARGTTSYYQERWPLFPPNEPEGIYQTLQGIAHTYAAYHGSPWEELLRAHGNTEGGFLWRTTLRVSSGHWDEFLQLRQAQDRLMQQHSGLACARTFRSIERDDEALALVRLRDRESLDAIVTNPEIAAVDASLMKIALPLEYPQLNVYHSECFEIVDEYLGAHRFDRTGDREDGDVT